MNRYRTARLEVLLALREWAFDLLFRRVNRPPLPASESEWELFVRAERCGIALHEAASPDWSVECRSALERAAMREMQRVVGARAAAREFGEHARTHGWRPVVLKGGTFSGRPYIDVADLDVLVHAHDMPQVADVYRKNGYAVYEKGQVLNLFPSGSGFPLDVHQRIREIDYLIDDSVPSDFPGLNRMRWDDLARLHLVHAGLEHGDRRGTIRDLYFLRELLSLCSAEQQRSVQTFAHQHSQSRVLLAMTSCALGLAEDFFRESSALRYIMWRRMADKGQGIAGRLMTGLMMRWGADRADGANLQALNQIHPGLSSVPVIAKLENGIPPLGRVVRRGSRIIGSMLAQAAALIALSETRARLYLLRRRAD